MEMRKRLAFRDGHPPIKIDNEYKDEPPTPMNQLEAKVEKLYDFHLLSDRNREN